MPLSLPRRCVRGFNQAEVLAQPLGEATGAPVVPGLLARRHRAAQSGLDRAARLENLSGAFRAPRLDGLRVLLVDDVVTTGATISAAAATLRRSGANDVTALVVARTPDQK
jgi:ComF family protein